MDTEGPVICFEGLKGFFDGDREEGHFLSGLQRQEVKNFAVGDNGEGDREVVFLGPGKVPEEMAMTDKEEKTTFFSHESLYLRWQ